MNLKFLKTKTGLWLTVILGYLALALVMTWPMGRHLGSYALIGLEDGSMSFWNLWWMKYSITELGQSPLFSTYLFAPDGASLTFHSIPKVMGLLSIPLQYLTGTTAAFNIILLLTFVLTGLSMYWLVYYLSREHLPAFVAGAFFAFSPIRWDHLGHLQLLSTMLLPVFILLIIRGRLALAEGGIRPWIHFALAGVTMAVTAYDTEYYALFMALFAGLYLVYYLPWRMNRAAFVEWGKLLLGLALSGVILALLFLPMLLAAKAEIDLRGDYVTFPPSWAANYARDLFSFFVPQERAHFLGSYFAGFTRDFDLDNVFLGWSALLLALAGIWRFRRRRDTWFWVVMGLVSALLVMGPHLTVGHRVITEKGPYLILSKLPVINSLRVPARFGVITMLAVAVLAGFGASALFGFLRRRGWARIGVPLAAALMLFGIFFEYRNDFHLTSVKAPAVYSQIAASDTPGAVISLPLGWEGGAHNLGMERTYTQLFQMEHQRPMVGGMMARVPKEQVFRGAYTPVIDFLADPVRLEPSDLDRDPQAIARFQERYQVAFIVVHKQPPEILSEGEVMRFKSDFTPEALSRVDNYVIRHLGFEKFAEDEVIVAYRRR